MPPISVTIFASDPGTYYLQDDGIAGNSFSQIVFPDGTAINFENPTNDLIFDPSVAGVTLVVNLTDSLGAANFSTGDFADPLSTPDQIQVSNIDTTGAVTLVANNAITEFGVDAAADIVASTLILSASTGVGIVGAALETQVSVIEAETITGGINLLNFGTVSIGGLTAEVDGLDVITSGNILFNNFGAIVLSDDSGPETIHGGTSSGNVTLTANGVDSDIIANIDQDSISAPSGDITLTAGRDIGFGLIGSNFDNDVRASGTVVFNAGRDVLLDGFADIASDDFGNATGGNVVFNAGRNIGLLAIAGTDAGILASGSAGADIILNTGPGGMVTLNSGNGTAPFASLISLSGDIVINADRLSIGTNGAISSVSGLVTIQPRSEGWEVDIGSATDAAFALEISDAEIDRIFTTTLSIGGVTSGLLNVSSAISPLNALNLVLRSGTDIGINASMTVGGALTLLAGDNLFQVPASAINIGGLFTALVDQAGNDGNLGAFAILNGSITASAITVVGNIESDTLHGTAAGESLTGAGGNDTLRGFGGNDVLDGGTGLDLLIGGLGNDVMYVDVPGDTIEEAAGEGNDIVYASASYTLTAGAHVELLSTIAPGATTAINLTGNELDNSIVGNAGVNLLSGGDGNDVIDGRAGNDTLNGGAGDDVYYGDSAGDTVNEIGGGGNDTVYTSVSYVLTPGSVVETLSVITPAATTAINLTGNIFSNTIFGNAGANVIDGGGGADTLSGAGGNDVYYVDTAGDFIVEGPGGGNDTLYTSVSYVLALDAEVETMSTISLAATTAINLTGSSTANTIFGNAGANVIDGRGGNDTLVGLGGNDVYYVDSAGDSVSEVAAGGTDTVYASVTYTLALGSEVEVLSTISLAAVTAINLTGSSIANTIYGNAGANVLDGRGGNDTMVGFAGNDTYYVDAAGDFVLESAGNGTDTVYSSVTYVLALGAEVETLSTISLAATTAINLTGSNTNNTIFGNAGNNILDGRGGADLLVGLGGNDVYYIDSLGDVVSEVAGNGNDTAYTGVSFALTAGADVEVLSAISLAATTAIDLTGSAIGNTLYGNAGANVLDGRAGSDLLQGFGGADTYAFSSALGASNVDTILGYSVVDDTIQLDDAIFSGLALGALAAGAFNTGAAASDADDRIVYNSATGALLFDPDGTGAAAAIQFATLSPGLALAASEFVVV